MRRDERSSHSTEPQLSKRVSSGSADTKTYPVLHVRLNVLIKPDKL